MIKLSPTTIDDISLISEWSAIDIDESHHAIKPDFWLTGNGFLTLKIVDDEGIVFFARFDECREKLASGLIFHTQFAPESIVSKDRVARAINLSLTAFIEKVKADGIQFLKFETTFPELAAFMQISLGFRQLEGSNEYVLNLIPKPVVKVCPDCDELIVDGKAFHLTGCQVALDTAAPTVQPALV